LILHVHSMIHKEPLVSVIMNCYNGEKFLSKALDSVLNQTYKNWELIFWDNQSKDKSSLIFKLYDDNRFKYFLAKAHDNLYSARNYAVDKCRGEFIAFLDVDDYWIPSKLEKQVPLFSDKEVGLVYSNFVWKNELKGKEYLAHKKLLPSGYLLDNLLIHYPVGLLTVIIRRTAFYGLKSQFNPEYNIIGDFDLAIRLSIKWKFLAIEFPTAYCRWHGNNLQHTQYERQILELQEWVKLISKNKHIHSKAEFLVFRQNIKRMRSVLEAQKGNYLYSIKSLFKISGVKNKFKIIAAILLPKSLFSIISSR
jgi:glycosyltransferase involved in cell wall biosynthesis